MRCPVCGIETSVYDIKLTMLEYTVIDVSVDFEREVSVNPEKERTSKDISRFEIFCRECDSDLTHLVNDGSFEEIVLQTLREKGGESDDDERRGI